MKFKKVGAMIVPEGEKGVCVWEVDGKLLSDGSGYLSLEGEIGDIRIEKKMRDAAYYWLGERAGQPKWIRNARKITDAEYEDQFARFLDGKIPDEMEVIRQVEEGR